MCGIAGILSSGKLHGKASMSRMLDALRNRGPDDSGLFIDNEAVLGQRRLSIIDLEGGHQPIPNEDHSLWIVCNGEIYNYQEIREDLIRRGHTFSTHSDSEVVLHLYEEKGENCVDDLRGMFAFAIWDQNKKNLFAARDRLGQKPFYYVHNSEGFFFASEIKALLALQPTWKEMDPESLDQYLTLRIIAPPRSMFKEIRKLPPAHSVSFSLKRGISIKRYWDLNFEPKISGSESEILDQLEEKLIEAIKLHMVSDVPVGAFLSGGMDSTLVVSMLMKHMEIEPIKTFTMGLPYGNYNEAPFAKMVSDMYGTDHHEEVLVPSLTENLPELVGHLDEPSDPLSVCAFLISRMARKHVKVVLGGDGGDELFGGYDRYFGYKYAGIYGLIPSVVRRYGIEPLLNLVPDGGWYKSKAHQIKWLHSLSFMQGSKRYSRSLSYFYFGDRWRQTLYGSYMLRAIGQFEPEEAIWKPFDSAKASNPVDKMLCADSFVRLPDHPVMISDRMTMANSLELRSPLMDHKIVEFAARIPVSMKVRGRKLRYIQQRLLERYIPKAVLERPKQGFSSALPYMLADEYKKLFDVFLKNSELAGNDILRQSTIDSLLSDHLANKKDNGNRLWLLLNSEVWYRMYINGQSNEDIHQLIDSH